MTLVASPTPSILSIASSTSASSVGERSPRQFSLNSFSDVSPLTPNQYRNAHPVARPQSHSQPSSPSTSVVSNLPANRLQTLPHPHTLEDANRLGGKNALQTSARSVASTFGANAPKKEKKKLTTRRLIDREKHSANECRRRTEMREKFLQLQEITHCVYKDRQNILITAIRRIAEQNARIARLEKEKQAALQEVGRVTPRPVVSSTLCDSSIAIPANTTIVTAVTCKTEDGAQDQKPKVAIPVNTLASIGATDLLPSFLLVHPDTIVDVNAAFLSLFHVKGRESVQSSTLSNLCASSQDIVHLQSTLEQIIANDPHHGAVNIRLIMNAQNYDVQLILRAIVSPSAPPQIYGIVSEQKTLPKEVESIVNIVESPILPAVIIKGEPEEHLILDASSTSGASHHKAESVNLICNSNNKNSSNSLVHSSSMSNLLDGKTSNWSLDASTFPADSLMQTGMDTSESLYPHEDHDSLLTRFNASPFPINLSNHFHPQDQFMTSVYANAISNGQHRPSISSAFVDTTIWNDIM